MCDACGTVAPTDTDELKKKQDRIEQLYSELGRAEQKLLAAKTELERILDEGHELPEDSDLAELLEVQSTVDVEISFVIEGTATISVKRGVSVSDLSYYDFDCQVELSHNDYDYVEDIYGVESSMREINEA